MCRVCVCEREREIESRHCGGRVDPFGQSGCPRQFNFHLQECILAVYLSPLFSLEDFNH